MATVFLQQGGGGAGWGGRRVLPVPMFSLFCGQSSGNKLNLSRRQPDSG